MTNLHTTKLVAAIRYDLYHCGTDHYAHDVDAFERDNRYMIELALSKKVKIILRTPAAQHFGKSGEYNKTLYYENVMVKETCNCDKMDTHIMMKSSNFKFRQRTIELGQCYRLIHEKQHLLVLRCDSCVFQLIRQAI